MNGTSTPARPSTESLSLSLPSFSFSCSSKRQNKKGQQMSSLCQLLHSTAPTTFFPFPRSPVTRLAILKTLRSEMEVASRNRAAVSASDPPGLPPLPERRIVLGVGGVSVDFLATVDAFPKPDDKIRSTSLKVQGGGNAGNAMTCAARLGLKPRLISKVANDSQGRSLLSELEADGVDTSYMVVAEEGNSPFTYVIVDKETNSRTCIHTPGYPGMIPQDLSPSSLSLALDDARLVYFDVRLPETAVMVAKEATNRCIPILVDAEKKREGLDELLSMASYVVCTEKFPQAWTDASSIPRALLTLFLRLPHVKFVIVTLGEKCCLMLERRQEEAPEAETDIDSFVESLKERIDYSKVTPTCIFSEMSLRLTADGIGAVTARLYLGTAEKIPHTELVDTTGAGDAFIGAILYAICAGMPADKMLPFASQVAAAGCRALGARTGLPKRTDISLLPFLL